MNMLDHVPEHQRDAIAFLDLKIAHLEGQIVVLRQARAVLGGELEDVDLERDEPAPPAIGPGHPSTVPPADCKPRFGDAKVRVTEALANGPLTVAEIAERTGIARENVLACLHGHKATTFCKIDADGVRDGRWRLRQQAAA